MKTRYTIGRLAKAVGVATSTVRYYERRGLLVPDGRSNGNYRVYGEGALEKLRFVRAAQAAGFTLGDIEALLAFGENDAAPCKKVQDLISTRLESVEEQMEHLRVVDRMLRGWMTVCHGAEQHGRCGVLEGLQPPSAKKIK